jgi:hypothetical protein
MDSGKGHDFSRAERRLKLLPGLSRCGFASLAQFHLSAALEERTSGAEADILEAVEGHDRGRALPEIVLNTVFSQSLGVKGLLAQLAAFRQQGHGVHQVLQGDDTHQPLIFHHGNDTKVAGSEFAKS